jgi:hypothetical protein
MTEQLLQLPKKPGTVIAIGEWWLVRLRPYEDTGAPSAWELLPMPTAEQRQRAEALDVATQCVYGDEWVLAEAEQEGGYVVISDPRDTPSGVQYFTPEEKHDAEPEERRNEAPNPRPVWDGLTYPLPLGARVQHTHIGLRHLHGEVAPLEGDTSQEPEKYVGVRWDPMTHGGPGSSVATVRVSNLEPELIVAPYDRPIWSGKGKPPIGARVQSRDTRHRTGVVVGSTTADRVDVTWDGSENTNVNVKVISLAPEEMPPWKRGDWHGVVEEQIDADAVRVKWDHDDLAETDIVFPAALEREQ